MSSIKLTPHPRELIGAVALPASKSISNRALICDFLSDHVTKLQNISEADDTRLMIALLNIIKERKSSSENNEIYCRNAGTVFRFLTALLSITPGKWLLTGTSQMEKRPIKPLVDSLIALGADITYEARHGFPPLLITGKQLEGGRVNIQAAISSQFVSALLMIAPKLKHGLQLNLGGPIISAPYISLTLEVMKQFGVTAQWYQNNIQIKPQQYQEAFLEVEPDWSSAAFWYELAALAEKPQLLIRDLKPESLQGDAILPEIFNLLGINSKFIADGLLLVKGNKAKRKFEYNFKDTPDLFQAVAATCTGLGISGIFQGIENLSIKETDRLVAMAQELKKFGCLLEQSQEEPTNWQLKPKVANTAIIKPTIINTYGDHRMAMAFAPLALKYPGLVIKKPAVVSKSFPEYWQNMASFFDIQKQ